MPFCYRIKSFPRALSRVRSGHKRIQITGGGSSRPTFPSSYAAREKFTRSEIGKVVKGFEDSAGKSSITLEEFVAKFPPAGNLYAKLLFFAIRNGNRASRPLTSEEFLTGYSVIAKGTGEETSSFCFEIFDINHRGKISPPEFHKSLTAVTDTAFALSLPLFYVPGSDPPTKEEHKKTVDEVAKTVRTELNFEQFVSWLSSYRQIKEFVLYSLNRLFNKTEEMSPFLTVLRVQPPLMLKDDKSLLTPAQAISLRSWLPEPYCKCHLFSIFSTKSQGYSLETLFRFQETKLEEIMKEPSILIIQDDGGNVFGGFFTKAWFRNAERFYGSEESFVFSFAPEKKVYRCIGDSHIMYSTPDILAVGGKLNYFGFSLDAELVGGTSHACATFGCPQLAHKENFRITAVQLWGLIDVPSTKSLFNIDSDEEIDVESLQTKEETGSIWEREESWVLDQLKGVGYSKNLPPPPDFSDEDENQTEEKKKAKRIIMPLG